MKALKSKKEITERFMSFTQHKNGCWEWVGFINPPIKLDNK